MLITIIIVNVPGVYAGIDRQINMERNLTDSDSDTD